MRAIYCVYDENDDNDIFELGVVGLDGNPHTIRLTLQELHQMAWEITYEIDRYNDL